MKTTALLLALCCACSGACAPDNGEIGPDPDVSQTGGSGGSEGGSGGVGATGGEGGLGGHGGAGAQGGEGNQGAPPQVDVVPCDIDVVTAGPQTWVWAEREYPGKTMEELARVSAVVHLAAANVPQHYPPGYTSSGGNPIVTDGKIAVLCGVHPNVAESVTLVLPDP